MISNHNLKGMEPYRSMDHACYYKRGPRKSKFRSATMEGISKADAKLMDLEDSLGDVVNKLEE